MKKSLQLHSCEELNCTIEEFWIRSFAFQTFIARMAGARFLFRSAKFPFHQQTAKGRKFLHRKWETWNKLSWKQEEKTFSSKNTFIVSLTFQQDFYFSIAKLCFSIRFFHLWLCGTVLSKKYKKIKSKKWKILMFFLSKIRRKAKHWEESSPKILLNCTRARLKHNWHITQWTSTSIKTFHKQNRLSVTEQFSFSVLFPFFACIVACVLFIELCQSSPLVCMSLYTIFLF